MRWRLAALLATGLAVALASGAQAQSCDTLGGDADGDGICDDGSGSGVVGDLPCSCQPPAPPACVVGCDDNCPFTPNPDQLDVGRVGDPDLPDGIGDACQCLDVSDDGRGNLLDSTLLARAFAAVPLPPPLPAPDKCLGAYPPVCDGSDRPILRETLAGLNPAPPNLCPAAGACSADPDCPDGTGCDLTALRCKKFSGAACVEASQCLGNGCCSDSCRNLTSDVGNCGGCGIACTNPNGTTACVGGGCSPSCSAGFGSCDGSPLNGCETPLNTLANCAACNTPCDLANATESCSTGTCQLTDCNDGYANCDDSEESGCELRNAGYSNDPPGEFLGSFAADIYAGFLCPTVTCHYVTDRQYPTGRYFRVTGLESSTCSAQLRLLFHLDVPPGVDYDLYLGPSAGCACSPSSCISEHTFGEPEDVLVYCDDDPFSNDDFNVNVRVHFYAGSSCQSWRLRLSAGSCP